MKRPLIAIVSASFALSAVAIAGPFLSAVVSNPASQDTPAWLALGIPAALAAMVALQSCIQRDKLSTKNLAIRAFLCCACVLPAALLLGSFTSNPP